MCLSDRLHLMIARCVTCYRDPIVDLQYCPSQNTLYGLHDPESSTRAYLQKWDATTGQSVAGAYEFMEKWSLTCFCITDQEGAGNEVIAGAANTGETAVYWVASCMHQLGGLDMLFVCRGVQQLSCDGNA